MLLAKGHRASDLVDSDSKGVLPDSKALNYLSHSIALYLNIHILGKKSIILHICPT